MLGVRRESLQGALIALTLILISLFSGLGIERKQLNFLSIPVDQFARLREDVPRYRLHKAKRRRTQQLRLLASLPSVGPDRAHRLLDHFGSVQACITATAFELEKVSGIGPKTAAAIRDLVSLGTKQSENGPQKPIFGP